MVSVLPLLMGLKQCFDNLGNKLAEYFKCRSNCCYQVNVYNPKSCAVMGSLSNRWARTATPVKKDESFYTPKN